MHSRRPGCHSQQWGLLCASSEDLFLLFPPRAQEDSLVMPALPYNLQSLPGPGRTGPAEVSDPVRKALPPHGFVPSPLWLQREYESDGEGVLVTLPHLPVSL